MFHSYDRRSTTDESQYCSFFDCQIVKIVFTICVKICCSTDCTISITSISHCVAVATFKNCVNKAITSCIEILIHTIADFKRFVIYTRVARFVHIFKSCLYSIQQCFWNIYWNFCTCREWLRCISQNFRIRKIIHHAAFISSCDWNCISFNWIYQNDFSCSRFSICIQLFNCSNHSSREQVSFSICDFDRRCTARQICCNMRKNHIVCRHCSRVQIIYCKSYRVWVYAIVSHYDVLQVKSEIGLSETHCTHQSLSVNSRCENSYHQIFGAQTSVGSSLYNLTLHHCNWFQNSSTHCRFVMYHHHLQ